MIDVAGLVASSLNMSDANFLANRLVFDGGGLGGVSNLGSITTPSGGSVYLIGSSVSNAGIITSPQGQVLLAAGSSVSLADPECRGNAARGARHGARFHRRLTHVGLGRIDPRGR